MIVGFGDYRAELERLAPPRTLFTGPLEHRHLVHLLALADVTVVPSIFPEAFGMVAAEAASAGSPPLVARHSGLAEVAAGLEEEYPPPLAHLASFPTGDADALAEQLNELLALPVEERRALGAAARRAVERRWSWTGVAERLLEPFRLAGVDPADVAAAVARHPDVAEARAGDEGVRPDLQLRRRRVRHRVDPPVVPRFSVQAVGGDAAGVVATWSSLETVLSPWFGIETALSCRRRAPSLDPTRPGTGGGGCGLPPVLMVATTFFLVRETVVVVVRRPHGDADVERRAADADVLHLQRLRVEPVDAVRAVALDPDRARTGGDPARVEADAYRRPRAVGFGSTRDAPRAVVRHRSGRTPRRCRRARAADRDLRDDARHGAGRRSPPRRWRRSRAGGQAAG